MIRYLNMSEGYLLHAVIGFIVLLIALKISKTVFKFLLFLSIGLLLVVVVTGCSGRGNLNVYTSLEDVEKNTLTRIQDMPFYKKSKIYIEKSLIFCGWKMKFIFAKTIRIVEENRRPAQLGPLHPILSRL